MQADDCAFWETDERTPYYFNNVADYPGEGVSTRHFEGGIQGTFGGAVNYIKLKDWNNDVSFPGRNRLWCNPDSPDGGNVDTGLLGNRSRPYLFNETTDAAPVAGMSFGCFEIFGRKIVSFWCGRPCI